MKSLNLQIEELNNLSKIIAIGSAQDVNNFTDVISSFFWRFNLKSYAYFEELFKEFAEVSKLLESLLLLERISDIIKHDQHINRYMLLLELVEITEETYCAKVAVNPIVKRLSALIEKPGLATASMTIRKFMEIFAASNHENLRVNYKDEEGGNLLRKLQASEKRIKELSSELGEINAHRNNLTTGKNNKLSNTVKRLQKQVKWFERSILEEAVNIYQRYNDLKKKFALKNDELLSIKRKNNNLEQYIVTLKDKLRQQTATIHRLEEKGIQLKKQAHKRRESVEINSVKVACEILEIRNSNPGIGTVKKKYKELAQKWHPDLYAKNSSRYQLATEIFQEINEAKEYLCLLH